MGTRSRLADPACAADSGGMETGFSPGPPPFVPPRRPRPVLLLRLALTGLALALLWHLADGPAVLVRLAGAQPLWLAAALAAASGQILLSALRWQRVASALGQPLPLSEAVREYYLAQFINFSLPGGILGDAGRALRQRHRCGLWPAGQAVVIERMAGQVALLAVTGAGFAALARQPGALALPHWAGPFGLIAAGLFAGALAAVAGAAFLPGRAGAGAQGFLSACRRTLMARRVWPAQAALGLAIVACNLGSLALAARATGTAIPPLAIVTVLPLVLVSMLVPLTIGGWGLREGAAAALWPAFGATAAAGVASSVAFGLVIWAATLPGLAVALRIGTSAGQQRRQK